MRSLGSVPIDARLQKSREWDDNLETPTANARIVIVSNRGPKDFEWNETRWVTRTASGGLVSMLAPLARRADVAWFCCVSEPPGARASRRGLFTTAADQRSSGLRVTPIPIPAPMYHAYYGQISNEVLWMLQHQLIGPGGYSRVDARQHRAWTEGYLPANRHIADAVAASCPDAEAFLIQDYHLYPLPELLRQRFPHCPILHFTHVPFPNVPLFRLLPPVWRDTILRGLLGANVVGFQTRADVESFLGCCVEFLRCEVNHASAEVIAEDGRRVAVRAYPASVDPESLKNTMQSDAVALARRRLAPRLGELSIIRVDRLDPSKNQAIGFLSFSRLLEMRPDLRRRVRFSAFLVPSRTDLSIYRAYRSALYRTVEEINHRYLRHYGEPPIEVFYTNNREQALAAMEACDVLLVNSLQDGMNLVVKEWALVSQRPGVLVLSETAGVVHEARDSALLVSPLDVEGTARSMNEALKMPNFERAERLAALRSRVQKWTAHHWLSAQLADLEMLGPRNGQPWSFNPCCA